MGIRNVNNDLSSDLFALMGDLTNVDNPDRVVWVFVNALAQLIGGENIVFESDGVYSEQDYCFKVATSKNYYGIIKIDKKGNQISKSNLTHISKAVGILAIFIESVEQRLIIDQEGKQYLKLEEKKNEQIFQNLNIYRQILENSNNIVLYFNQDYKCLYANSRVKLIQQDQTGKFNSLHLSNINLSFAVKNDLELLLNTVFENKKTLVRNITSQWNNKVFEFRLTPEFNMKDDVVGIVCFAVDVTDKLKVEKELLRAKEKAEESDMLKLAFLTNISHEIRSPLNGIMGFSKLMLKRELPKEKIGDYLQMIETNSTQLLKTLSNIIEVSRLQSGDLKVNNNAFCFHEFLYELFKQYKQKNINNSDIEFCFSSTGVSDKIIIADKHLLEEVIMSFLDNAFKFTKQGEIVLGYYLKDKKLFCFVKDTGIGIKKSKLMLIFNKFYQVDHSVRKEHEGLGLGLTLSKALVEKMGGDIRVESVCDKGTTIYFSIPYNQKIHIYDPNKIKNGFAKTEK